MYTFDVTSETSRLYAARIESFHRNRPDLTWSNPRDWAHELQRRELSRSSIKAYASAIRYFARLELREKATHFLSVFDKLYEDIRDLAPSARRLPRPCIDDGVIHALERAGMDRHHASQYALKATKLMAGIYHFGLRPSEWEHSQLVGSKLRLKNGKYLRRVMDHGIFKGRLFARANGEDRTILIESSPAGVAARNAAASLVKLDLDWAHHASQYAREFRNIVNYAIKRRWLHKRYRRITLYSMRHQFAANAKATFTAKSGKIAALMGHIAVKTALSSYARRLQGSSSGLAVKPSVQSVDAVSNKNVFEMRIISEGADTQMRAIRQSLPLVSPAHTQAPSQSDDPPFPPSRSPKSR